MRSSEWSILFHLVDGYTILRKVSAKSYFMLKGGDSVTNLKITGWRIGNVLVFFLTLLIYSCTTVLLV